MKRIYLDNNATTGLDPRVKESMLPHLGNVPANPSSVHFFGQEARALLTKARHCIADYFQLKPNEVIFTSGGTESLNMLLKGAFPTYKGHIITSSIEHSAVFNTIKSLEGKGCTATYLSPGFFGAVQPDQVKDALQKDTRLIALSAVNSETGVKCDIEAIAKIAEDAKVPFIVDGVALLGKEPFSIPKGVSGMAFSAHKFHGPKGIGLCLIRSSFKIDPLIIGGDQEYGKRSGTENLAGIAGLDCAIELLKKELPDGSKRMLLLRDRLENGLKKELNDIVINGQGPRIVNTSNISFIGVEGEDLLMQLDMAGVAASHGSACSSGALEPSRVLMNMGIPKEISRAALRFSLSRFTTDSEIDACIELVSAIVKRLRKMT